MSCSMTNIKNRMQSTFRALNSQSQETVRVLAKRIVCSHQGLVFTSDFNLESTSDSGIRLI